MAIVSPSIRRSLHRFLAQSLPRNANAAEFVGRYGVVVTSSFSRRTIHSTRILSGDALDMADTFSRRHGKNKKWVVLCNITSEIDSPATCYYRCSEYLLHPPPPTRSYQWDPVTKMPTSCSNPSASTPSNPSYLLPSQPTFSPAALSTYNRQ